MPSRFDAYRMKDGATPLSERFFNPVFRDIDLRIASIEELRIAWDEVVRTVTDLGLVRINEVLAPAFSEMQANMELADQQLALIESHRDAATRAVAGLELAIATYQGNAAAEIAAWKADLLAALVPWKAGVMADLEAWKLTVEAWKADLQNAYLQNVAKPSAVTITYDAQGRPQYISEVVAGQARESAVTFNGDGTPARMVTSYQGIARTEEYQYNAAGLMVGLTATEGAA